MKIREKLQTGRVSLGSWMQIPSSAVAEIMGKAGYDWVVADLEHGVFPTDLLCDIFRSLELGGTLPLARIAQSTQKDIKQALDCGARGLIFPMTETAAGLRQAIDWSHYPPRGTRGVGYSRANLYGKNFEAYAEGPAQEPLIVAQIESIAAVRNINAILDVKPLDAVIIGPYDLSASMDLTAQFEHPEVKAAIDEVLNASKAHGVAMGIHVVQPDVRDLHQRIQAGYQFIAYSLDAVFFYNAAACPVVAATIESPNL